MPNETDKLVLKLDSGYNIGISKNKIKSIKVIEKYKASKEKSIAFSMAELKKQRVLSLRISLEAFRI